MAYKREAEKYQLSSEFRYNKFFLVLLKRFIILSIQIYMKSEGYSINPPSPTSLQANLRGFKVKHSKMGTKKKNKEKQDHLKSKIKYE